MFAKLLILHGLAVLAAAQSSVLSFTHVPDPVTDGQPQAITYATNDTTTPVTIILRKGESNNLQTISTLTTSSTSGQYIWTPDASLPDDNDYALEITQGTQVNYFGPFAIQGQTVYSSSSASASASTSSSAASNSTTAAPIVPGTVGTMSAGTGTALPRNTTMSIATLSSSASSAPASNSAASTSGAGSQGTSTAAAPSATKTSGATVGWKAGASIFALALAGLAAL